MDLQLTKQCLLSNSPSRVTSPRGIHNWPFLFICLTLLILLAWPASVRCEDAPQLLHLDFNECIRRTMEKSPRLGMVRAKIQEAEGRLAHAKTGYNPVVTIDAGETYVDPIQTISLSSAVPAIKLTEPFSYNAQVSLRQLVSSFGRRESAVQVARFSLESVKEDYQRERDQVNLDSRKACLDVLRTEELVKVAQSTLDFASHYLKIANVRYKAGVAPHFDVTRAEVAVNRATQNRIAAMNARDMAQSALLSLLELSLEMPFVLKENLTFSGEGVNLEEGERRALQLRPELKRMDRIIDMAAAAVTLASRENNPNLLFVTSYAQRTETIMTTPSFMQASMLLNIPVYDGGAAGAHMLEARGALKQAMEARREVERGIRLEVKQVYLKHNESIEMVEVAEKNVIEAKEGHRVAEFRFSSGIGASLEVTDSLSQLTIAETSLLQALYNYHLTLAEWKRATVQLDEGGQQ